MFGKKDDCGNEADAMKEVLRNNRVMMYIQGRE
jgi:hypothetical protein